MAKIRAALNGFPNPGICITQLGHCLDNYVMRSQRLSLCCRRTSITPLAQHAEIVEQKRFNQVLVASFSSSWKCASAFAKSEGRQLSHGYTKILALPSALRSSTCSLRWWISQIPFGCNFIFPYHFFGQRKRVPPRVRVRLNLQGRG